MSNTLKTMMLTLLAGVLCASVVVGQQPLTPPADPSLVDRAQEAASFRAELGRYLYDLEQLPVTLLESMYDSPLSVLEAKEDLSTLSDDELLELKSSLSQVPYWRSMPRMLAASLPTEQYFTPLELAASLDIQGFTYGPEQLRTQLLDFVAQLERIPGSMPTRSVSNEYLPRIERIREQILTMTSSELIELQQGISTNSDRWTSQIQSLSTGSSKSASGRVTSQACNSGTSSCGGSFPGNVLCEIDNVIKEIVTIPCYVGDFAQQAVDLILDGLIELFQLLASVIPSPQDLLNQFENALVSAFSRSDWQRTIFSSHLPPDRRPPPPVESADGPINVASEIDAVVAIPCPVSLEAKPLNAPLLNFPLLGEMGTIEGHVNCQRRALFIADIVKEIFPSDVAAIPLKIAYVVVQAIYYIVDYLCMCFEAAHEIHYDDNQEAHRDLVKDKFTNGAGTLIKVSDLGSAATLQSLQNRIDSIQTQVGTLDSSVDDLNNDIANLDGDVVVVNSKLAASLVRMDDAVTELEDFMALALRLRMEADLTRDGEARVGLFQLPNSQGGYLEEVDAVVEFLINDRLAAGRDQSESMQALNKARILIQEGAYKKAYSQYRLAYRRMTQSGK